MKTWFYFYVQGANKGETIKFSIKNMNKQAKLYSMGLRPVYRVIPKGKGWQRIPGPTKWNRGTSGLEVHFQHTFAQNDDERVYFAFTYPFSYHDIQEKTKKIEEKLQDEKYNDV